MNEITLLLIIFFTLYNGVDSKIKHKNFIKASKWIDKKSRLFIKNFAFKSNKELFPYLYNKNKSFFVYLFIITAILVKLDFLAFPISLLFITSMLLNAILISKEDLKKEIKNSAKFWGFGILSTAFFVFLFWYYNDKKEYEPIRQIGLSFKNIFEDGANVLGVDVSTFIILILIGFLFIFALYFIAGLILRGLVWLLLLILKCYAKFCFSLNRRQPLKSLYLLSQTIIIIISYAISKITTSQ